MCFFQLAIRVFNVTERALASERKGMPSGFGFVEAITSSILRILEATLVADFKACCLTQTGSVTPFSSAR
jgi:hypothetical protein